MLAFFEAAFGTENGLRLVILIAAVLALGLYLKFGSRNKVKSHADKLQEMYRVMDSKKLEGIPDSELFTGRYRCFPGAGVPYTAFGLPAMNCVTAALPAI